MVVLWYCSLVLVGGFTMYAVYNDVPPLYAIGAMLVWMLFSFVLFRCTKCGLSGLLGYEGGSAIPYFPRLPGATCARCGAEL
jgi:hypothetical protein